jgi:hypothetical protein
MIYTAQCVMFLMRADTLCGEVGPVGEELALEISRFLGPKMQELQNITHGAV